MKLKPAIYRGLFTEKKKKTSFIYVFYGAGAAADGKHLTLILLISFNIFCSHFLALLFFSSSFIVLSLLIAISFTVVFISLIPKVSVCVRDSVCVYEQIEIYFILYNNLICL